MTDKTADTKEKVEQKVAVAEKIENKSPTASKTKKKKKNKDKVATEAMDNETIHKLVDQKLKELGMANEEDKELKRIKKKYKAMTKVTPQAIDQGQDDAIKLNKLVESFNQLLDLSVFFEEHTFVLSKLQAQAKGELDIYQNDIMKMNDLKTNLEKFARDVQKNNVQIKEVNKKFVEEETQRREDILKSFETTLSEITTKLEEQKTGAIEQGVENEKLRAQFEEKISGYEKREKEFFEQIKELDSKNDERTKGVLGNLKDIEERAKQAFEIKDEIQAVKRQSAEDQIKVSIYSQRFGELDNTFQGSFDVLKKFKSELLKSGSRVKALYHENKELKSKSDKIDRLIVEIFTLNEEVKKKLENNRKEKDALKDKCNIIQNEIMAKTKRIQEIEQTKSSS